MVALVVGGLLMAVLVALAGSVQKTFGQTKNITELQANLRFAMRTMVEDFHRVSFMYAPDPERDPFRFGPPLSTVGTSTKAIVYDDTAGAESLILRGNFVSSRDYRIAFNVNNTVQILCRNGMEFIVNPSTEMPSCGFASDVEGYDPYLEPFADGPLLDDLFCPGEIVRMDIGSRKYMYLTVAGTIGNLGLGFNQPINRDIVRGAGRSSESQFTDMHAMWINPITNVQYRFVNSGTPPPYGSFGTVRWVLERWADDCRERPAADLAEFMLPPDDPNTPGMSLRVFPDTNWGMGATAGPWQPAIDMTAPVDFIPGGQVVDWTQARAIGISLRARTAREDPNLFISSYPSAVSMNFGYDLDNNEDNGLAHVRVENTVIHLQNMALAPSPAIAP
jgi:hypothetical protein